MIVFSAYSSNPVSMRLFRRAPALSRSLHTICWLQPLRIRQCNDGTTRCDANESVTVSVFWNAANSELLLSERESGWGCASRAVTAREAKRDINTASTSHQEDEEGTRNKAETNRRTYDQIAEKNNFSDRRHPNNARRSQRVRRTSPLQAKCEPQANKFCVLEKSCSIQFSANNTYHHLFREGCGRMETTLSSRMPYSQFSNNVYRDGAPFLHAGVLHRQRHFHILRQLPVERRALLVGHTIRLLRPEVLATVGLLQPL